MKKLFLIFGIVLISGCSDGLIGGDKDEHGCVLMGGYIWCESKQECLRVWEADCPEVIEDNYIECSGVSGDFCIQVYDPVCGDDGQTYSNNCVACKQISKYKTGECE